MATISEIVAYLKASNVDILAEDGLAAIVQNAAPISDAGSRDISFLVGEKRVERLLAQTKGALLLVGKNVSYDRERLKNNGVKVVIRTELPRLDFARVLHQFFSPPKPTGIHTSAVVDPAAQIHPSVYIGPFTYVGKCFIDSGTILYGHNHVYDNTRIGRNVTIHAGAVIGADGFGYAQCDDGSWTKFPHLGGVAIEDNVEIGANACIDRGTLSDTVIRQGAKLDNLVHIAHNVDVGQNAMVIAHAMIAGSTRIGENAWIAPGASLIEKISVGDRAKVGIGAVVIRNVKADQTVMGQPARTIRG